MKEKILEIARELENCEITEKQAQTKFLFLFGISGSFISVGEQEPPKHIELLVQSPEGVNYITSWRDAYSIFACQNKNENSYDWKWKEI